MIELIHTLKNRKHALWAIAIAILLFDVQYFALKHLPSTQDEACAIGGALTVPNILFAILVSVSSGLLIAGILTLAQQRRASIATTGAAGVGIVIGLLTSLCLACVGPVIILITLGNTAALFNPNSPWLKAVSLIFLFLSLVLVEKQLRGVCHSCKPNVRH